MSSLAVIAGAYLLGAIPFGWLVAKSRGVDIFKAGSGNIGATNVGRVLGRKYGAAVFLLDVAKGAVPVGLARLVGGEWTPMLAGLAAFIGHMFPIYLKFRGGKGVATGLGAVATLMPVPAVAAMATWLSAMASWRMVSFASVLAVCMLAFVQLNLSKDFTSPPTLFALLAAALVVVKHRSNLQRIKSGTELVIADSRGFQMLTRILHVTAVGLWFGSAFFFSLIAAPSLFQSFERYAAAKPEWLPIAADLGQDGATRLAGAAVAPMFPPYFALSAVCGLIALGTAYGFYRRSNSRVTALRCFVVSAGLFLVVAGWPLVKVVADLRVLRYTGDEAARSAFGLWHGISLVMNLAVVGLTGLAMLLCGALPETTEPASSESARK